MECLLKQNKKFFLLKTYFLFNHVKSHKEKHYFSPSKNIKIFKKLLKATLLELINFYCAKVISCLFYINSQTGRGNYASEVVINVLFITRSETITAQWPCRPVDCFSNIFCL